MLAKHIINLLEKHNKVIVPDLGAFMIKIDGSHSIFFNEFLRFNDGMLVDSIARSENIDMINAAKITKNLVDQVNKLLITEKAYELKGIGTLICDKNGKISLKSSIPESNVEDDKPKEIAVPHIAEQKSEKPEEVIVPPIASELLKKNGSHSIPVVEKPTTPENTKKEETPIDWHVITPTNKPIAKDEIATGGKFELFANNASWIIPLFLILLMASAYFLFFRSPSTTSQPITITEDTTKTPALTKSVSKDSAFEKTTSLERSVSETKNTDYSKPSNTTNSKLYYLVAGCFKFESNADNFVSKLRKEGYDSKKIGKLGSFHYVSFKSFDKKTPALKELKRIREDIKVEAWLIYY